MNTMPLYGFGGASPLNFRVIGGTVKPELPSENTIWVQTDIEISVYEFSATEPAEPVEGMVWISTGSGGTVELNILKKNVIEIYPVSAKQYISGAWVDKIAEIYQNGVWAGWWQNELYTPGNEWGGVTGGWTGTGLKSTSGSGADAVAPTITRGADSITAVADSNGAGVFHTAKKINLKPFDTIIFKGEFRRGGSANVNLYWGCWSNFDSPYSTGSAAGNSSSKTSHTELTLDISGLDGEYYVGIGLTGGSSAKMSSGLLY